MYLLTKTVIFLKKYSAISAYGTFFIMSWLASVLLTALLSLPRHDEMQLGNGLEVNAGIAAITCRLLEFYFIDMLTSFGEK